MKVTNYVCNSCDNVICDGDKITLGRVTQIGSYNEIDLCHACATNFAFFCVDNRYKTLKHPPTEGKP